MIEGLPAGVRARPATRADLLAVVDLFLTYDATLQAEPDPLNEYLQWIWGLPYVDLARDTVLLLDDDGVVGFAQGISDPETGGPFSVDWGVALAHDLDAVGAPLLTWCERQRDDREIRDPIRTSIVAEDDRARALLEGRGYVQVRLMWDMVRSLGEPQDLDVDPDGVEVRAFRVGQDEQLLYRIDETSFRDHWDHVDRTYEAFAARMFGESWDPSLAFLAEVDGEPAGELVAIADVGRGCDRLGRGPPRVPGPRRREGPVASCVRRTRCSWPRAGGTLGRCHQPHRCRGVVRGHGHARRSQLRHLRRARGLGLRPACRAIGRDHQEEP